MDILKQSLQKGNEYKFVFFFRADILNEKFFMIMAFGPCNIEHSSTENKLFNHLRSCQIPVGFLVDIGPDKLGAGYVKIENNKFIFFGKSTRYGKFSKDYLILCKQSFIDILNVEDIEFQ